MVARSSWKREARLAWSARGAQVFWSGHGPLGTRFARWSKVMRQVSIHRGDLLCVPSGARTWRSWTTAWRFGGWLGEHVVACRAHLPVWSQQAASFCMWAEGTAGHATWTRTRKHPGSRYGAFAEVQCCNSGFHSCRVGHRVVLYAGAQDNRAGLARQSRGCWAWS